MFCVLLPKSEISNLRTLEKPFVERVVLKKNCETRNGSFFH